MQLAPVDHIALELTTGNEDGLGLLTFQNTRPLTSEDPPRVSQIGDVAADRALTDNGGKHSVNRPTGSFGDRRQNAGGDELLTARIRHKVKKHDHGAGLCTRQSRPKFRQLRSVKYSIFRFDSWLRNCSRARFSWSFFPSRPNYPKRR